jgi:hypothetical protein
MMGILRPEKERGARVLINFEVGAPKTSMLSGFDRYSKKVGFQ